MGKVGMLFIGISGRLCGTKEAVQDRFRQRNSNNDNTEQNGKTSIVTEELSLAPCFIEKKQLRLQLSFIQPPLSVM